MTGGPSATWLTCAADGLDHAITDEEFALGRVHGSGRFSAVCDATVWVSSLASPPSPRCGRCDAAVRGSRPEPATRSGLRRRLRQRTAG